MGQADSGYNFKPYGFAMIEAGPSFFIDLTLVTLAALTEPLPHYPSHSGFNLNLEFK